MTSRLLSKPGMSRRVWLALPGLAACLACLAGSGILRLPPPSLSAQSSYSAISAPSLIVSPDPIALGVLAPGQVVEGWFSLRNSSSGAVAVERIETGCSCLSVSPDSLRIEPQATARVTIRFDLNAEPDFRGELSIELTGHGTVEEPVFRTRVNLEVQETPTPPT